MFCVLSTNAHFLHAVSVRTKKGENEVKSAGKKDEKGCSIRRYVNQSKFPD